MSAPQRLPVLDMLRGIASFAVCWFHLTNGNVAFLPAGILKSSGAYGWLGVEVFFVISGFVIPYALERSRYGISDCGTFLLKRVVRLDPPYFITIGLILALGYLSAKTPGYQGEGFIFSWPQTLLHVGYLNAFFNYPWLNPVFWSLAIELQYYLLIALIFPLLASRRWLFRFSIMLLLAILSIAIPAAQFVFHWLLLFLFGIATFQFRSRLLKRTAYFIHIAVIATGAFFCYGALICLTGLASALVIAFINFSHFGVLGWFGKISYSLYLLHAPIGGRIINFSSRFATTLPTKFLAIMVAAIVSILAAWALHKLVEHPAQRWSAAIGYRKRQVAPSGFAPRVG
jgi:peptidoglycan/LPS O-acetylase OafA/YrhL